jgi:hypothetical protein
MSRGRTDTQAILNEAFLKPNSKPIILVPTNPLSVFEEDLKILPY